MTYEDFVVYSVIAIAILFIILVFWIQNKEIERNQEIKQRFNEFNKRLEEIRRKHEASEEKKKT